MAEFSLQTREEERVVVFIPKGYLEDLAGMQIAQECRNVLTKGFGILVFDFTGSPVITSTGLAHLLDLFAECVEDRDMSIGVCGLSPLVRSAFRAIGLLGLVTECAPVSEAIQSLTEA